MHALIILCAVVASCVAAPQFGARPQPPAPGRIAPGIEPRSSLIVKQAQEVNYDGSFTYDFQTDNGIASQAVGQLKNVGAENEALVITGSYSYIGDDGQPVEVTYIADENGFQPQSSILPTPPPIPEAIQKALDFLRSLPPTQENQRRK